ncbi:ATP-binding cassette domain-containing protein [Allonocardiopsis opalescens]|uniref:Oleandomycin transport system ATP-binding protein n=1 Tax=Allonocardiopsis opalescens TaxID=1144618 RepID=A0A2T0PU69_9ACTN|nr:ATP-binding cassette domain-containing protein [Allonocardiopsis opalescens]PRX92447.1 oleandomycin transport system ATP-binding protein [Allonocardiopsis opalescens]
MTYAIQAEGLVKNFGTTRALDGVSLRASAGRVLGVLGPNGAGKTTAVRVLATLIAPDAGHATVNGFDVVRDAHQVRRRIGLTGQYAAVDEELSGAQNLVLIGRLLGLPGPQARARAAELLAEFDLTDAGDRRVKTYSGGMRRRLDLGASLVGRPSVLYLDEPTTGLDPRSRGQLWEMVRKLVADGVTVLLTTQYLEEADHLAHDIVVIDHGKVIATGTPDQLKDRVGGQILNVQPVMLEELDRLAGVVREVTGVEPNQGDTSVSAPVDDPAVLPAVVRRLDAAGIGVAELALRKATLDEVFLALTGHTAEPGGEPDAPAPSTPSEQPQQHVRTPS